MDVGVDSEQQAGRSSTRPHVDLTTAAITLAAFGLVVGVRRTAAVDDLAFFELPGVTAWLALALLGTARTDRVVPTSRLSAAEPIVIAVAVGHTLAWWLAPAWVRGIASAALLAAGLFAGVVAVRSATTSPAATSSRSGGRDSPTVSGVGFAVSGVVLGAAVVLEFADAVSDLSDSDGAAVLGARGPSLGAAAVALGMALAERHREHTATVVDAPPRTPIAGTVQMLTFGAGWLGVVAGAVTGSLAVQVGAVGLHVLAVGFFVARHAATVLAPAAPDAQAAPDDPTRPPRQGAPIRWYPLAVSFAAAYVALLFHFALGLADRTYGDGATIPTWLVLGVDLSAFVGLALLAVVGTGTTPWAVERWGTTAPLALAALAAGAVATAVGAGAATEWVVRIGWAVMAAGGVIAAADRIVGTRQFGTTGPGQDAHARLW